MNIPIDNQILFYRRDRSEFGFLSNFHESRIEIDGICWPTVEHYYQAQKSLSRSYHNAIFHAQTPGQAKRLGTIDPKKSRDRKHSLFVGNSDLLREDWFKIRLAVMEKGLLAKFQQNDQLARALAATGNADLIEDSRSDFFWGVGADGTGSNHLGRLLMKLRMDLHSQKPI